MKDRKTEKKEGEKTKGIMAARSWLYSSLRG